METVIVIIALISLVWMAVVWAIHKSLGHKKDYSQRGGYNYPYKWSGSSGSLFRDLKEEGITNKLEEIVIIDKKVWKFRGWGENKTSGYHYKFRTIAEDRMLNLPKDLFHTIIWTGVNLKDWNDDLETK